jgi:hypothetical protein
VIDGYLVSMWFSFQLHLLKLYLLVYIILNKPYPQYSNNSASKSLELTIRKTNFKLKKKLHECNIGVSCRNDDWNNTVKTFRINWKPKRNVDVLKEHEALSIHCNLPPISIIFHFPGM